MSDGSYGRNSILSELAQNDLDPISSSLPNGLQHLTKPDPPFGHAGRNPEVDVLLRRCVEALLENERLGCQGDNEKTSDPVNVQYLHTRVESPSPDSTIRNIASLELEAGVKDNKRSDDFFLKFLIDTSTFRLTDQQMLRVIGHQSCVSGTNNIVRFCKASEDAFFPGTQFNALSIRSESLHSLLTATDRLVHVALSSISGYRDYTPSIRFAVPRSIAGSLIGKNGDNIKQLRQYLGVSIHISPRYVESVNACPERIVHLGCQDEATLRKAVRYLAKRINKHAERSRFPNVTYRENSMFSCHTVMRESQDLVQAVLTFENDCSNSNGIKESPLETPCFRNMWNYMSRVCYAWDLLTSDRVKLEYNILMRLFPLFMVLVSVPLPILGLAILSMLVVEIFLYYQKSQLHLFPSKLLTTDID